MSLGRQRRGKVPKYAYLGLVIDGRGLKSCESWDDVNKMS